VSVYLALVAQYIFFTDILLLWSKEDLTLIISDQIIYRYKRFGALNCRPLITQKAFGNSVNILDVPFFTKII